MNDKQRVALRAVEEVKPDMRVGLGTGSTANYFIESLAEANEQLGLNVQVVSSSVVSAIKARQLGLSLLAVEQVDRLDLYVDGADEVAPDLTLLKGRGYDLVREKLLAQAADRFLVLVDASKIVNHIGERYPIPVEVMPFAWQLVMQNLEQSGCQAALRQNAAQDGLAITSHGSLVLDVHFPENHTAEMMNECLNGLPGVVEHGIFRELTSAVYIGNQGQVEERSEY